jgi:hypothetical protein
MTDDCVVIDIHTSDEDIVVTWLPLDMVTVTVQVGCDTTTFSIPK